MSETLTTEQTAILLRPIAPHRVHQTPEGHSHVEAYDIRATLNRIFGFAGWSLEETSPAVCVVEQPHELRNGKPGVKVAYRAHLTITILATGARYAGSTVAEATMPDYLVGDAHDMALKSAESGALKRAASNLGDQFGLSLYNDGSVKPLVVRVVGFNTAEGQPGWPKAGPSPGDALADAVAGAS
jgi:recombination DNA repair RAD52 pathway protein